jgi:predicted Zn-dependent protease
MIRPGATRLLLAIGAAALLVAGGTLFWGCSPKPRAPVLRDEPYYQNDKEGFRFLAPEGWKMSARSELPPGKLPKETTLVNYRRPSGKGAAFVVTAEDLPASADLAEHLARGSYGVTHWVRAGSPTGVKAGNAEGTRYSYTGRSGREELAKEVVAVRRGERVYFFITVYPPTDAESRDQVRRVVENIDWKG